MSNHSCTLEKSNNTKDPDQKLSCPSDHQSIALIIENYLEGARSGNGNVMKDSFHKEATIFGFVGEELMKGAIEQLFSWTDQNGPATELQSRIVQIDIAGTVASVRVELENWTGFRFTDMFTLLKFENGWRIVNKVFHLHADG